jgi:Alternative complex III, ActD subunit
MSRKTPYYGLMAEFANADDVLRAVRAARQAGYRDMDAFSPYPVEGLAEELGLTRNRVPLLVLLGGLVGAGGGYFLQYWAMAIDYPVNIGGRPYNSWPAYIPITFEVMVLVASFAAILGMFFLNGLPMPYHPVFHVPRFARASQDRFFLCIEATDPSFDLVTTRQFLHDLHPAGEVVEVPH